LLHDTWLLFSWSIKATLRSPVWALIGLFQPLCYLFLFGPLLQPLSHLAGFPAGGAQTVFVPGVMVMMSIFNTAFVGFNLVGELRAGFIERLRITPLSRLALPLGRVLRDIVLLLIQSLLLVAIALPMGAHVDLVGLVFLCGLLALLGLCLASCSYGLALTFKDENALSSVLNTFNLPLFLLSGITLPLTLAPPVLRTLGNFNPLAYAVDTARALFLGDITNATVVKGFVITGVLALAALFWAFRAFQRATT
ncbi:MAG TPA: ABC transporter permease, partial [Ktedonobacteraceae bacterium]|nr:ABC transporter permease [Ktedonobacteraceae bacterium]